MISLGFFGAALNPQEYPSPVGSISQVQEWPVAFGTSNATGPAISSGNLVVVRSVHRSGTNGLPAEVTDNGENSWILAGQAIAGGSGDVYLWYCENAKPFTQANVVINGNTSSARILFVAEWKGVAKTNALIDSESISNPSNKSPAPALVNVSEAGALVTGTLGATVSNRVFNLLTPGYTSGLEHRAQQTTLISAARADVPPGLHGPQWEIDASSTASTSGSVTAAFRPER